MTDSMIPNSFVPGTKAKASEVNENFLALANAINSNKNSAASGLQDLSESLSELSTTVSEQKADKSELFSEFTINEENTDLNTYKNKGTYIFSESYIPTNVPVSEAGILVIVGDKESALKQTWFCYGQTPEIFTRTFKDNEWQEWHSAYGHKSFANPGYIKLPGGLLIQWGFYCGSVVTYPIAYSSDPAVAITKMGANLGAGKSDSGFEYQALTGFSFVTSGYFGGLDFVAVGYKGEE